MYISRLNIQNWRTYKDVTFEFKKPIPKKPLILIGAMNGVGKTSFLMSLYIGLFGRHGLRFVENHKAYFDKEENLFYRSALESFRKRDADSDDPTVIDITISPTDNERLKGVNEVRILRRWYFNPQGKLRQSSTFEDVQIHLNDGIPSRPTHETGEDHEKIQNILFKSDIVPAFFFDGEQAQSVINASGNLQVKNAVDILFGTSVLHKSQVRVKSYIDTLNQKTGGKKNFDERKNKYVSDIKDLGVCKERITELRTDEDNLKQKIYNLTQELDNIQNRIIEHGGDNKPRMEQIRGELKEKIDILKTARNYIYSEIGNLALEMALHRYRDKVSDRLEMESEREKWDTIRMGTELKLQDVISKALPEPYYHDPLLCDLPIESWENLRNRFKSAIEGMYNPPPIKCADSFLLVFVNNKDRIKLSNKIEQPFQSISIIQHKANEILTNDQIIRELNSENKMLQSNSENIKDVVNDLNDYNTQRNAAEIELSHLRVKLDTLIESETTLKSDIDSYREFVNQTKISKTLLNIADSTYKVFDKWLDQLRPMTVDKLINLSTKKFLDIADSRFKGGHILIDAIKNSSTEVKPFFVNRSGKTELFENMSGFERRSFGIAYSLALTQLTNYRAPLVIDTPLGNADGEYRVRLLKALANADLDQIILLSHDQEITEELHNEVLGERITSDDGTYFLVEYDESLNESTILPNHYFY